MMKKIDYFKLSTAIIFIAAVLRFAFALTHTVSGDACWHLSAARFIATENEMPLFEGIGRLQPFWAPPLFHFIAAFFYKIFIPINLDFADLASKLVSPIFGTLSVIIIYLIARKLFEDTIAFYVMVFINFIPVFLDYTVFSFTESTVTFFSILSVYLMLNNRLILSSIAFGMAMLSKYNAVFVFPMLLYLAYRSTNNGKERLSRLVIITILPLLISSIWFIRNSILLKNPVWPFLNDIFNGVGIGTTFSTTNFGALFSLSTYLETYLEMFGVPTGNLGVLLFVNFPFLNLLVFVWFLATLIFIFPFIKSFFTNILRKNKDFLKSIYILFISFLIMFMLYVLSLGWFSPRLLLPITPFMAILWAIGLDSIKNKKIYFIITILISLGFIGAQYIKLSTASEEWNKYSQDFQWAKTNTKSEDLFFGNGQCLSYNINRFVIDQKADIDFKEVDYVWVNNDWRIDFIMNENALNKIEKSNLLKIVYNNQNTGTIIYEVIQ